MIEQAGYIAIGVAMTIIGFGIATVGSCTTKSEKEKVYDRICGIIEKFSDVNPKITEIKHAGEIKEEYYSSTFGYSDRYLQKFEVSTGLGSRYLAYYDGYNFKKIQFLDSDNILFEIEIDKSYDDFKSGNYIYKYKVEILPSLDSSALMSEKQIFDCLVEVEQIFEKYQYSTKKAEHNANLNKFISRF